MPLNICAPAGRRRRDLARSKECHCSHISAAAGEGGASNAQWAAIVNWYISVADQVKKNGAQLDSSDDDQVAAKDEMSRGS
jgi:hypothetical protein